MKLTRKFGVLLLALVMAVPALAQETADPATATLAELRAEAQRLTALAQVPEAGRAEAEALLARVDALTESARSQEIARLQAYIAALRAGDSPAVAEEVASSAVSDSSVELARQREALQADVSAFLETYPDAASVFRRQALGSVAVFGYEAMGGAGHAAGLGRMSGVLGGQAGVRFEGLPAGVVGFPALRARVIQGLERDGRGGSFQLAVPYGSDALREGGQVAP